jgi:hypothetical protein
VLAGLTTDKNDKPPPQVRGLNEPRHPSSSTTSMRQVLAGLTTDKNDKPPPQVRGLNEPRQGIAGANHEMKYLIFWGNWGNLSYHSFQCKIGDFRNLWSIEWRKTRKHFKSA